MLTHLETGLDTIHGAVEVLRRQMGRVSADLPLIQFEIALAEIGSNSLRYGHPAGSEKPRVELELRMDSSNTVKALLTDWGPPLHNPLTHAMPAQTSEAGRGLALARKVLDELGYQREGEMNKWRLVKRL
jgi:serine/threonine-protein kinase RsbW